MFLNNHFKINILWVLNSKVEYKEGLETVKEIKGSEKQSHFPRDEETPVIDESKQINPKEKKDDRSILPPACFGMCAFLSLWQEV